MNNAQPAAPCRCGTCGAPFATAAQLAAHLAAAYHGVQCLVCGAILPDRPTFAGHSARAHGRRGAATQAVGA